MSVKAERKTCFSTLLIFLLVIFNACQSKSEKLYQRAERVATSSKYEEAAKLYEQVFVKYRDDKLAESALFEAANLYYHHLHQINRAIDLYQKLLALYPASRYTPQAQLKLAEIYELEVGDTNQAISLWHEMLKTLSSNKSQLREIELKIADGYFKLNEFDKALAYYQDIAQSQTGHMADKSNLKIGVVFQMLHKYQASIRPLLRVVENSLCTQCRYAAQLQLIETYENLEEFDKAIEVARKIDSRLGTSGFKEKELARLKKLKQRIAVSPSGLE